MVRSLMTLYQSWLAVMTRFSACSSVTPDDVERRRPGHDRLRPLLDDHVDAGDVADELEDVLDRRVGREVQAERRLRRRVQDRRLRVWRRARSRIASIRAGVRDGVGLLAQLPLELAAPRDRVRVAGRVLERPCGTRPARSRGRPCARARAPCPGARSRPPASRARARSCSRADRDRPARPWCSRRRPRPSRRRARTPRRACSCGSWRTPDTATASSDRGERPGDVCASSTHRHRSLDFAFRRSAAHRPGRRAASDCRACPAIAPTGGSSAARGRRDARSAAIPRRSGRSDSVPRSPSFTWPCTTVRAVGQHRDPSLSRARPRACR